MEVFGDLLRWSVQPLAGLGWVVCGTVSYAMVLDAMRSLVLSSCLDHQTYFSTEIPSNRDYLSAHSSDNDLFLSPVGGNEAFPCSKRNRNYKVTAGQSRNVLFKRKEKEKKEKQKALKGIVRAGKIAVWEEWETEFKELLVH